ncbi:hypothetical protein U1Q18_038805 [Sarracenia purpurea var. burkii]
MISRHTPYKAEIRTYLSEKSNPRFVSYFQLRNSTPQNRATMAVGSKSTSKLPEQKGKFSSSDGKMKEKEKSRKQPDSGCLSPAKRAKCPGVRLVGHQIYNSENGKTCHQVL